MNYCNIKNNDISNGLGVRISLFVSGCRNHCKNCFQPETWDFNYGEKFDDNTILKLTEMLSKDYISGISILGGEPLEPENQLDISILVKYLKDYFPNKNIWLYTGFTWDELHGDGCRANTGVTINHLLRYIDVLVDGRFEEDLKDITLKFRGSKNQRLIDVKKTLESGSVVTLDI